jgi:hypothetical protein
MRRIPKRFQLLSHTIEVVSVPASRWKWEDYAYWDIDKLQILVCRGKATMTRHSFWHEVAHALLDMGGRADLSKNETLVDVLGGLLAQMTATAEY